MALLSATALFVGCDRGGTDSKDGATAVKLQLNWVPEAEFGGIYQAQLDKIFERESLDVEIRPGVAGVSAPQLVDGGEVEFGIVGGPQVLELNSQGGELVALFAVFQHDPHGIMVPTDSPYKGLADLWADPNATIGAETYLPYVKALNKKYGVPDGAQFASFNLPAFRAGKQQASQCFVIAEPVNLELQGFKTRVFLANESGFDPYNVVLVTRRSYLEKNRDTCEAMVRAFSDGWNAYIASPNRVNKLMSELNPAMSEEAMNISAERQISFIKDASTEENGLGYMTKERWETIGEQLRELGLLETVPAGDSVFEWLPAKKKG